MLKKITNLFAVTVLILGLTQQASAHPFPCGPYAGIDAGLGHFSSKVSDNIDEDTADSFSMAAAGFTGNFMLGWAFFMSNFYFALEGLVGLSTGKDSSKNLVDQIPDAFVEHDLSSRYQYGGAFNAGYMLLNTLLFVRLGLTWANYKLSRRYLVGNVVQAVEDTSSSKTLFGFSPGVGMAMMLNDCLMLSALFTYTIYQSHTFRGLRENATNEFPSVRIRPHVAAFTIGLTWFFGQQFWPHSHGARS